ncbi:MAG: LysR substrate-binding domain-containing protein [Pseudomonadota bacterium]
MGRPVHLRQVEIFKAVIEHGTVSRAADVMAISQPAASKLLANLEADTELALFDRHKGRLVPTPVALRLYEEIDRIFSAIKQVETAIQRVKHEHLGHLSVGVIPALSDRFIQRATTGFMGANPKVHCSVQPLGSQWIAESLRTHQIDFGIMMSKVSDPDLTMELLSEDPLVCILPKGHELGALDTIRPEDLQAQPFVSFKADSLIGKKTSAMLEQFDVTTENVVSAYSNATLRQFVAAGQGISLVHPLFVADIADQLEIRPFSVHLPVQIYMCHASGMRNRDLIESYMSFCRTEVSEITRSLKSTAASPT